MAQVNHPWCPALLFVIASLSDKTFFDFDDLILISLFFVNLACFAHLRCLIVCLMDGVWIINFLATAEKSLVLFITLSLFFRLDVINFALVWMLVETEHILAVVQDCTTPTGMITCLHRIYNRLAQDFIIDECWAALWVLKIGGSAWLLHYLSFSKSLTCCPVEAEVANLYDSEQSKQLRNVNNIVKIYCE